MPRNRELTATYLRERQAFDNDDGSRVVIASAEDADGQAVTLKGDADKGELSEGCTYRFFGRFKTHPRHGEQFLFDSFVLQQPAGKAGTIAYLQQCDGIGPSIAHKLWDAFKADAVATLREDPAKTAEAVPRLKMETAEYAAETLRGAQDTERATLDLMALLDGRGFPRKTVARCIKWAGVEAAGIIARDPFRLMKFRGVGFLGADKMYLDLGRNPARLKRQAYCLAHAINSDDSGSTWLPINKCERHLRASLAGVAADPPRALELAVRGGILSVCERDGQRYVADVRQADAEERIADAVNDALNEPAETGVWPNWPSLSDLDGLSDHQRAEAEKATAEFVGVLRGSPGTGKTYTVAAIARAIIASVGVSKVAFAAPTGKAAVRLTEALDAAGVGVPATTIHSLLRVASSGEGGWSFEHYAGNPLPHRFIFVDESSMVDSALMASLLDARATGTHVLFVGDPYQLPPVGRGKPFLDLAESIPGVGELREVRRNAGRIVEACAAMRDLEPWEPCPPDGKILPDAEGDAAADNLKLLAAAEADMQDATLQAVKTIASAGECDPTWDVQVLVPLNDKGPVSRKALNGELQTLLNPSGESAPGNKFRVGDKVVCLKNGRYSAGPGHDFNASPADDNGKLPVANGELAAVVTLNGGRTLVRLSAPDRLVWIPGPGPKAKGEEGDDSGGGGDWDLGYALSVHKSQGSEWPVAIVVLDPSGSASRVASRNWLYTGVSRAKRLCLLVGSMRTAESMCDRNGLAGRLTLLAERLRGEEVGVVPARKIRPPKPVVLTAEELDDLFARWAADCEADRVL